MALSTEDHEALMRAAPTLDYMGHLYGAVEQIVARHVAVALNAAADELAAFNLEADMHRVPRHVDVADDYESGVNDAARIVRAATQPPP